MTLAVKGKALDTDERGFLLNPEDWNEDVMDALIAAHEAEGHKPLSETAKGLVEYVREVCEDPQKVPGMHELINALGRHKGESVHEAQDHKAFLYDMFPHGPVQMLAKRAGLPNPGVENER